MEASTKKIIGTVAGVALGAGFALLCPDLGLGDQGVRCLGILLGAIAWWVAGVLPEYVTGLVMVALFTVFGGIQATTALSGFATETWWMLVGAFGLGAGMKASGLMKRMAHAIVRTFPNKFTAQVAGLITANSLIGPLVPSMSAKAAMLEPIALSIGEALGYERFGKPMQGLFLAVFTSVRNIGLLAISASVLGYAFLAMLPEETRAAFDMLHWAQAALPWFIVATVLNYAAIVAIYRPRGKSNAVMLESPSPGTDKASGGSPAGSPQNAAASPSPHAAASSPPQSPADERTPLSRHEGQMCAIILISVTLWATEPIHGINPHLVALAGFACTIACGILDIRTLHKAIAWKALVFIGITLGLSGVFAEAGIQNWLVGIIGPAFETLANNPFMLVAGIGLLTVAMRFVIVSEIACLNIAMPFFVPLALAVGINPWVMAFSMYACLSPWFVIYQNSVYLPALYSVNDRMVRHSDVAKYCFVYTATCLLGLLASVPYWQWLGLM